MGAIPFAPGAGAASLIAPVADAMLASALAQCERLVAQATAPGLAFALDELGDIDIPDPVMARIDKAQLRALATLYLAADLEPAGIIPAVESLAGLASSGAASLDLAAAEPLVVAWWRQRGDRPGAPERNAFFSRLFGTSAGPVAAATGGNGEFEVRMLELCESLYKLDEMSTGGAYGASPQQGRVRAAARAAIGNLSEAGGGITAFMAGEIIAMLKEAFAILGHPALRGAFAARDLWGVVAGIGRLSRTSFRPASPYVRRGKAGTNIIAWLADVSDQLAGPGPGGPIVAIGHPVIGSAVDWLEATLDIGETSAAPPPPGRMPAPASGVGASPWSALGN
ncbi:MAG TPA: hypothetical protein VIT38_12825 [Allosphingosinicella sp.]